MGPIDGKSYDIDIGNGLYTFSWRPPNRIIERRGTPSKAWQSSYRKESILAKTLATYDLELVKVYIYIYIQHIISNVNSMHSFELGCPCFEFIIKLGLLIPLCNFLVLSFVNKISCSSTLILSWKPSGTQSQSSKTGHWASPNTYAEGKILLDTPGL